MSTTDRTNRRSTTWLSIFALSLVISMGCGGAPGESDDGLAFDGACELEGGCGDDRTGGADDAFDGEAPVDAALDDDVLPNDETSDPSTSDPSDPPADEAGRDPAGSTDSSEGRTPAPQPDLGGGRSAPPPNTSEDRQPATLGGPGTYDPSLPNRGDLDPDPVVAPTPECTPGESRCVAGNPGVVEQCGPTGFWTTSSCGAAELCTDSACTVACELSVEPSDSYVCYVPNDDGVNDGILWVSNDPERMDNGTLTGIWVHYTADGAPAPIRRVPDGLYHGGSWPYEWRIASAGLSRQAKIEFQLDQFSHLPGPLRTVDFTYWARRVAPIQIPDPQVTVNYETRAVAFAWEPRNGTFDEDWSNVLDYAYFTGDIQTYTIPGVFGANAFDHQGGTNVIGIEIMGDGTDTPPMDAYVNFVMLTVR